MPTCAENRVKNAPAEHRCRVALPGCNGGGFLWRGTTRAGVWWNLGEGDGCKYMVRELFLFGLT